MEKRFKCPIHGYISMPENYCKSFVDTPVFQRLRHIEQTGMRALYPSAHHDRFIHSLGVYHLGELSVSAFRKNSQELLQDQGINVDQMNVCEVSFVLACLLHDCCHAPFSHTFENEYNTGNRLDDQLKQLIDNDQFIADYQSETCGPAAHERASAIIVMTYFREKIEEEGGDPILVSRAILGCVYSNPTNFERLQNAFISLLNGNAIDVDKLDYIIRDTWSSGLHNISIDIERLLSSLIYSRDADNNPKLSFGKQALSVLQNVVEARNYLYRWIHGHHKVVYYQALLKRAFGKAVELFVENVQIHGDEDREALKQKFFETLFSTEAILNQQSIHGITFHLPTDGDIFYFMKQFIDQDTDINRLFSRSHHKSLWKSYIEFENIFRSIPDQARRFVVFSRASEVMQNYCAPSECIVEQVKPKILLDLKSIYVVFENVSIPYAQLFDNNQISGGDVAPFFYIYGPDEVTSQKNEIIAKLKAIAP